MDKYEILLKSLPQSVSYFRCKYICHTFQESECKWHCCSRYFPYSRHYLSHFQNKINNGNYLFWYFTPELMPFTEWRLWKLSVQGTTTERAPATTTEPVPVTTVESFRSETSPLPSSETFSHFRETNTSGNMSNIYIYVICGIVALVLLIAILIAIISFKLRRRYKSIQDEKTKGSQETQGNEDEPPSCTLSGPINYDFNSCSVPPQAHLMNDLKNVFILFIFRFSIQHTK